MSIPATILAAAAATATGNLDCSDHWAFEVKLHIARIGDPGVKINIEPGQPIAVVRAGDGRTWRLLPGADGQVCRIIEPQEDVT